MTAEDRRKIFDRVNEIAKKQPQEEASFCPSKEFREGLFRQCAAELGITILGEKDATISGDIIKTDKVKIAEANAKLRKMFEPRGVLNEEEEVGP